MAKKPAGNDPENNEANTPSAGAEKTPDAAKPDATAGKTYSEEELTTAVDKAVKKAVKAAEERAKLDEEQKTQKDLEDARAELRKRDARDIVLAAAEKAGSKNSRLLHKAIESDLEYDENGKVKNLEDLMKTAKSDYPELFGGGKPSGSANGGAGGGEDTPKPNMNAFIRRAAGREVPTT